MKAIILVGGEATKIWPYNDIRNKSMIPVSNRPILDYTLSTLLKTQVSDIYMIGSSFMSEIKHYYRKEKTVHIIETEKTKGNVDTLLACPLDEEFLLFYGDCLIHEEDIISLVQSTINTCLLYQVHDDCHHHIIANVHNHTILNFIGHPRGCKAGLSMVAGHFDGKLYEYLACNRGYFKNTKVGVGSPNEKILEETLNDFILENDLYYLKAKHMTFDLDKPWQILEANQYINQYRTDLLKAHRIENSAMIDLTAQIDGCIQLGRNSKIGRNVHIKGNVIIGDDTIIDQGVVIEEGCVIGNRCTLLNHCKIGSYTTIGHDCIIEHTAEIIGGLIMDKNYLYHHGEFFGLCGERCDLGAGSVCGTLRFDDGETTHRINGRKEIPASFSNATYLGDYTRAGVGVIFLPGTMVGTHCVIGAGTILNKIVKSNTLIYPKQELIEKEWGFNQYGW